MLHLLRQCERVQQTRPGLHFLDETARERLRMLVARQGLNAAARVLGLSRGVVSAAIGGTGVRKGSLELLRDALARIPEAV